MKVAVYCGAKSWIDICDKVPGNLTKLNYENVLSWLNGAGEGDYLIFGTDVIPYTIFNYPETNLANTPLFAFLRRGGRVIWIGDVPLMFREKQGKIESPGIVQVGVSTTYAPSPYNLPAPLPYPANFEDKPYSFNIKPSIVGSYLSYEQRESWRPVQLSGNIIPLSFTPEDLVPSWILPLEKGFFVRLFDGKTVDPSYVFSFPGKFESLHDKYLFGISYRIHKNLKLTLPKASLYVIVGDNNVGKTSILEAIALLDSRNIGMIISHRETETDFRIEAYLPYIYVKAIRGVVSLQSNLSALLIYPRFSGTEDLLNTLKENERVEFQMRMTEALRKFLRDIVYVYVSTKENNKDKREVRVLLKLPKINDDQEVDLPENYQDRKLSELGEGYRELINFMALYVLRKPDIVLIDDLEAFALHPDLLKQFIEVLLNLGKPVFITTQSMDVMYYVNEVAKSRNREDVYYILLGRGSAYRVKTRKEYEELEFVDIRRLAKGVTDESG